MIAWLPFSGNAHCADRLHLVIELCVLTEPFKKRCFDARALPSRVGGARNQFRVLHVCQKRNLMRLGASLTVGMQTVVHKHCGEASPIIRCQLHKRHNVVGHFAEEDQPGWDRRLANAYDLRSYREAKAALVRLRHELNQVNPSAARSLEEGLEETLTLQRLNIPVDLWKTLRSTNVIESAFLIVRVVCRNVKRWRPGDQIERWVGSGLLVAEKQFRRIDGYRSLPGLLTALNAAVKPWVLNRFGDCARAPCYGPLPSPGCVER